MADELRQRKKAAGKPSSAEGLHQAGKDELKLRERLTAYYKQHNPNNLSEVDKLARIYVGKQDKLWQLLDEKYGTQLSTKKKKKKKNGNNQNDDDDGGGMGFFLLGILLLSPFLMKVVSTVMDMEGGNDNELIGQQVHPSLFRVGFTGEVSSDFEWLKGTKWNWNRWNEIEMHEDGNFVAPNCNNPDYCRWCANRGHVFIQWGNEGLHILAPNRQNNLLRGMRYDGDGCFAELLKSEPKEPEQDLYETLGLDEDASDGQIKKAYRKLSLKYHPDKNPGEEAKKKFTEVRDAYEILNDAEKKMLYEIGGMKAVKGEEGGGGGGGMDPFAQFFGGGGRGGGTERGEGMHARVTVKLADLYTGGEKTTTIRRRVVCRGCRKKSKKKKPRCTSCGRCPDEIRLVKRRMGNMIFQEQEAVPSKEKCKVEPKELTALIEPGMGEGEEFVFKMAAEQTPGTIPGDITLVLVVQVR
jgi:curved DNA-binding protein CbpA